MPSKSVTTTPYKLWTGCKLDLTVLQPWGLASYFQNLFYKYGNVGVYRASTIFVRYFVNSKRYVFISENEDGSVTEVEFRDAIFIESFFLVEEALGIPKL